MRKTLLGLIAVTAIVTSMSAAAMAQTRHVRHAHAQAQTSETTRNAYGAVPQEAPADTHFSAENNPMRPDDWRSSVNGN